MDMNIKIEEISTKKPFNLYSLKFAINIIFISMGSLMLILLISFLVTNSKDDKKSSKIDYQKYREMDISSYKRDGYYIPKDDDNINYTPKKCSLPNCKTCYGNSKTNICTSCISPYIPIFNENNQIKSCQLSNKTEDNDSTQPTQKNEPEPTKTDKIECEQGYYLPSDDNKACKKCSITNCNVCSGTTNSNICSSCLNGYFTNYNRGTIISCDNLCQTGSGEKCLSCDNNSNICSSCNKGYYFILLIIDNDTQKPFQFLENIFKIFLMLFFNIHKSYKNWVILLKNMIFTS